MKNYNIMALQGMDMSDEEVAENVKTFPKELINTADMNLWLTWYYYLTNVESDPNADKVDKGLCEHQREWYIRYSRLAKQIDRMVIKIRKLKGA